MATELREISTQLSSFCRARKLEVGAAHISGVLNGLADRLSRHSWEFETGDWQIVEECGDYYTIEVVGTSYGCASYVVQVK
jgi:hypothetical protein